MRDAAFSPCALHTCITPNSSTDVLGRRGGCAGQDQALGWLCRSVLHRACLVLASGLALLSVSSDAGATERDPNPPGCSLVEPIAELARDGDLIFRRGGSLESHIVLALDRLGYSHVGLVHETPVGPVVIHSLPRRGGRGGHVESTPLDEFLAPDQADAVGLFRVADEARGATSAAASSWASEQARQRTPFDSSFDATTPDELYCTELIWAAYRAVGLDLLPDYVPKGGSVTQSARHILRGITGGTFDFILPSRLVESSRVQPLVTVDRADLQCAQSG